MGIDGTNGVYSQKNVNTNPSGFKKFMNPESAAINSIFGGEGDEKFKSYLNPLSPYSKDPEGKKLSTWSDPLMKTVDANIGGTHFQNLNPIHRTFFCEGTKSEKARSWIDPGMAAATSFIKDEKTAKAVYSIFNPVGGILSTAFDKVFCKNEKK